MIELKDCKDGAIIEIQYRGRAERGDNTIVRINGSRISYYNTKRVEVIE